jgi:hypothetical protein
MLKAANTISLILLTHDSSNLCCYWFIYQMELNVWNSFTRFLKASDDSFHYYLKHNIFLRLLIRKAGKASSKFLHKFFVCTFFIKSPPIKESWWSHLSLLLQFMSFFSPPNVESFILHYRRSGDVYEKIKSNT